MSEALSALNYREFPLDALKNNLINLASRKSISLPMVLLTRYGDFCFKDGTMTTPAQILPLD